MSAAEEVKFSLKVVTNKEKTKVLFVEAGGNFVDILLSFLTLPLGRIVKVLQNHYGNETPIVGCLNTLYNSVKNLDSSNFLTKGAKSSLLSPSSSFDAKCAELELEFADSQCEWFYCVKRCSNRFWSESIYYDKGSCHICGGTMRRVTKRLPIGNGVFLLDTATFIITDDLLVTPSAMGFVQTVSNLVINGMDNAVLGNVTFGLNEVMHLLAASLVSKTPLSDLLLKTTTQTSSVGLESLSVPSLTRIGKEENPNSKKMILKVTVQKSTNKLLFAQAKEDFVEFLFTLLAIPLGGVERLMENKTSFKSINNLHKSVAGLIDDQYFKSSDIKNKLMNPKLLHGYLSENQILPLTEEILPDSYQNISLLPSVNFPEGQGKFLKGSRLFLVLDDLTVTPYWFSSALCSLSQQMIPPSDVKEMEVEIGAEEALRILKASLTSNSALSNALMNRISLKQPKQEI